MNDVRLVATNPDDGLLVPVASNASGQLAVQSPKIEKIPNDIEVQGTGSFAGQVTAKDYVAQQTNNDLSVYRGLAVNGETTSRIDGDGGATFSGGITSGGDNVIETGSINVYQSSNSASTVVFNGGYNLGEGRNIRASIFSNGSAEFSGDVVIGSRGSKWLIRESNGVAMLVEQTRRERMVDTDQTEKVRDLPRELDLIEAALNEVMEKLRMTPPAGWEVWDGSDNSR